MFISELIYGLKYLFANSFVSHIPFWCVRKFLYRLLGMKIGKSHILMGVITDGWRGITIGDGVCINQGCHLDGRGGLVIDDNASISIGTVILSASHDKDDANYGYIERKVYIGKRVWLGANSTILPGAYICKGAIIAAGSVAIHKKYDEFEVYSGVPAVWIAHRNRDISYDLSKWGPIFR